MDSAILAPKRVDRRFRAAQAVVTRHPSRLHLQAARSEGRPAAGRDAPARPWKLPRLRHADGRGGALDWFRRAFRVGVSRSPVGRSAGADERLRSRIELMAWAQIYLPGAGWIDFDPTSGSVGNIDLVTVAVVPDPRHAIPLHGTYVGFPSDHLGMEVQVSVMSDSPKDDLGPSPTRRTSTTWPIDVIDGERRTANVDRSHEIGKIELLSPGSRF